MGEQPSVRRFPEEALRPPKGIFFVSDRGPGRFEESASPARAGPERRPAGTNPINRRNPSRLLRAITCTNTDHGGKRQIETNGYLTRVTICESWETKPGSMRSTAGAAGQPRHCAIAHKVFHKPRCVVQVFDTTCGIGPAPRSARPRKGFRRLCAAPWFTLRFNGKTQKSIILKGLTGASGLRPAWNRDTGSQIASAARAPTRFIFNQE